MKTIGKDKGNCSLVKEFPTVFDTLSPRKNTPIRLKIPPIKTATLKLNNPAPTAGVIVSSLAPIVNATNNPTPRAAVKTRGSVVRVNHLIYFSAVFRYYNL